MNPLREQAANVLVENPISTQVPMGLKRRYESPAIRMPPTSLTSPHSSTPVTAGHDQRDVVLLLLKAESPNVLHDRSEQIG